ncbi:MAG: Flp family type IVb pilin [Desulfitobacteriaceae bacterium]|nr:Flp family type IVb pilin [Desulfitobacteriaceae bacterium]
MKEMLKQFAREEDGQGMVEYALIVAGIAAVVIAALTLFGPKIKGFIDGINVFTPPAA